MAKRMFQNFQVIFIGLYALCGAGFPTLTWSHQDLSIEFRNQEKQVAALTLKNLAKIAPPVALKIFEIHENKNLIYKTYAANTLFDKIFGREWRAAEEIVFGALDGYQASIPVTKFLTHEDRRAHV